MTTMTKPIHTPTFAEAAEAVAATCRQASVNDGRRLESDRTLAEGCVR